MLSAALLSLVSLLALPGASLAQSVLTDDAHTSTAPKSADSNFGTNPSLNVSSSGNVYLKFKLSSTLPANTPGSAVGRATLKLYLANITTAGRLDLYAVSGAWDESTITANSAPPLGALLTTTAQIGPEKRHEYLVIDITALVRQWLGDDGQGAGGIPNHGLALVARPADATTPEVASVTFDSKENSQTSHEAQLNIQLERAAGALEKVEHDASLVGDGTSASPLGVAAGGINSVHLADDAVTGGKIANNAVTTSELADGAVTSAKVTTPLSLTSADAGSTLSVANTGAGAAITAAGAINTTTQYNIGGNRVLSVGGNQFSPNSNIFAGVGAGSANTTGGENSFFGSNAGLSNTTGSDNSFFGFDAGKLSTTSQFNSFFGNSSGASNTTGSRNIFAGWGAGFQNTTGGQNTFVGVLAGRSNTTGENNTHFGNHAGSGYQAGSGNTFIGFESGTPLSELRDGNNNTAVGSKAWVDDGLSFATAVGAGAVASASNTVVLGRSADTVRVPGALNVAGTFGANVLDAATQFNLNGNRILGNPGANNLFAGVNAGSVNTTGFANSFFGKDAGLSNTQGNSNSFFGNNAGRQNTAGNGNSIFGTWAGQTNTTGHSNSFFGYFAGSNNEGGDNNSFFGVSAGSSNTNGINNVFFGTATGNNNILGSHNTFVGVVSNFTTLNHVGHANTLLGFNSKVVSNLSYATAIGANSVVGASDTIVLGKAAGVYLGEARPADTVQVPGILNVASQYNIGGNRVLSVTGNQELPNSNIFVGVGAGANNSGIGNSFFGKNAGLNNTGGGSNSFFGIDAGRNNTVGTANAFFGDTAGVSNTTGNSNSFFGVFAGGPTTTGSLNTFVGRSSGVSNTTGDRNSFFGAGAGNFSATGADNTFIGSEAGFNTPNPTGDNNTLLGANAVVNSGVSGSSAIGYRAQVTQNNSLVLGGINGVNSANADTNVGIGTTAPKTKLHVARGKIYVEANGQGVILKSPGGSCFELTVTDAGALVTAAAACP